MLWWFLSLEVKWDLQYNVWPNAAVNKKTTIFFWYVKAKKQPLSTHKTEFLFVHFSLKPEEKCTALVWKPSSLKYVFAQTCGNVVIFCRHSGYLTWKSWMKQAKDHCKVNNKQTSRVVGCKSTWYNMAKIMRRFPQAFSSKAFV